MTQLKAALEQAGFSEWPSEGLRLVAIRAMTSHADNMEAAKMAAFQECQADRELLRDLFVPVWHQAMTMLFAKVREAARSNSGQYKKAPNVISIGEERQRTERQLREIARVRSASIAKSAEASRRFTQEWLATKARDLKIDDRPFWEASPARAAQWLRHGQHSNRFMTLVLSGLPPDTNRPISFYRRPEEIDAMWDRAMEG